MLAVGHHDNNFFCLEKYKLKKHNSSVWVNKLNLKLFCTLIFFWCLKTLFVFDPACPLILQLVFLNSAACIYRLVLSMSPALMGGYFICLCAAAVFPTCSQQHVCECIGSSESQYLFCHRSASIADLFCKTKHINILKLSEICDDSKCNYYKPAPTSTVIESSCKYYKICHKHYD